MFRNVIVMAKRTVNAVSFITFKDRGERPTLVIPYLYLSGSNGLSHVHKCTLYKKRLQNLVTVVAPDQAGFMTSDLSHSVTSVQRRTKSYPVCWAASCLSVEKTFGFQTS